MKRLHPTIHAQQKRSPLINPSIPPSNLPLTKIEGDLGLTFNGYSLSFISESLSLTMTQHRSSLRITLASASGSEIPSTTKRANSSLPDTSNALPYPLRSSHYKMTS